MHIRKLHTYIEAINSYYAFAVLVYTLVLFISGYSDIFLWLLVGLTPFLAAWSGYILRGYLIHRNQYHGFTTESVEMTYELLGKRNYRLRLATELRARANHLLVYPIHYQWSGGGEVSLPQITSKGQRLVAVAETNKKDAGTHAAPYKYTSPTQGDWYTWFVAFTPPVQDGEKVNVSYSQQFHDPKGTAIPSLYYAVRYPMKRLVLKVKFAADAVPSVVTATYTKPSDVRRTITGSGLRYDPDLQSATWVIDKPKKGSYYRIEWTM